MIRWIFFDIGNVLINDDRVMSYLYQELYKKILENSPHFTFEELLKEREEAIRRDGAGHWADLAERHLGSKGKENLIKQTTATMRVRYMEMHNVLPGMGGAVRELYKDYNLGLIANQLKEVLPALDEVGWDGLFQVKAISEVVGSRKPELSIFRWALDRAGCLPGDAVMIGDRVDNDIVPAKEIGMRTIWLHIPHKEKGTLLRNSKDRMYLESQRRISIVSIPPKSKDDIPDAEVNSAKEMLDAIRRIDQQNRSK